MTKQEIFDKVARTIIAQGGQSLSVDSDGCAYRGDNGRVCAAGALIDNKYYNRSFEGTNIQNEHVREALVGSGVPEACLSFLRDLQLIHDTCDRGDYINDFRTRMQRFASEHHLDGSVLS